MLHITAILSLHITSALTAVKRSCLKNSETAFSNSNVNYFWSIKKSSKVVKKLRLRNFQGPLSTFQLYTLLCHMILSKQTCCLLSTGVSIESTGLELRSVRQTKLDLATRNMTRINVYVLGPSYVKLLLSPWKIYVI